MDTIECHSTSLPLGVRERQLNNVMGYVLFPNRVYDVVMHGFGFFYPIPTVTSLHYTCFRRDLRKCEGVNKGGKKKQLVGSPARYKFDDSYARHAFFSFHLYPFFFVFFIFIIKSSQGEYFLSLWFALGTAGFRVSFTHNGYQRGTKASKR